MLVVIGLLTYRDARDLLATSHQVTHTHDVLKGIGDIGGLAVDAQSGVRGYLLTNEERYLEHYRAAVAAMDGAIKNVEDLTSDNAKQQSRLRALKPLVASEFEGLKDLISVSKEKDLQKAAVATRINRGKEILDEIRKVVGEMEGEENALLKQRDEDSRRTAQRTFVLISYGSLLAILVVFGVGYLTIRNLTGLLGRLIGGISSATAEILAGTTQQASGAREQAAAVSETATTVDEVLQTSDQAAQRAKVVAESSQRSAESGKAGRKAVEDSIAVMGTVKEQTESIAESILALAEQSQAIGEIIATVNDIAERTNLLALNAAIEASRAGEQGKGFAVVASEIKALADQSKKATSQVRQILGEIQKATNSAVMVTEEGTKSVNTAIKVVGQAGETIKALADTIAEAAQAAAQIAASAGQQATGMAQTQQAMKNINQVTNQNVASAKQAERAAQDLNELGLKLKQLLTGDGR
jgi:methyl-accepting chemotaxis protein